jgi:hypothetical protein
MLKDFFLKKMLKSKLGDVPAAEQEKIFAVIEKNPELFQKIGLEIQTKMKEGKDQMTAAMEVMQTHQHAIKQAMR